MNPRKRLTLILCIVYCVIVIVASVAECFLPTHKAYYSKDSDHVSFMGYDYVSDNTYGFGDIYQITDSGVVKKVYLTRMRSYISGWRIEKIVTSVAEGQNGGNIFALLKGKINESGYVPYRMVSYTENLGTDSVSPAFYLRKGVMVTGLSYDEGVFYITCVTESRQDLYIYTYNASDMITLSGISTQEREDLNAAPEEIKEVSSQRDQYGGRYASAEYENGTLHIHMDGEEANDYFTEDYRAKSLFDNRKESIFHKLVASGVSVVYIIAACIIGCIAIYLIVRVLDHRRRVVYRTLIAVSTLVVLSALFVFLSALQNHNSAVREFNRNTLFTLSFLGHNTPADMDTDEFFASTEYPMYYQDLSNIVESSDEYVQIEDVCVVDVSSGVIVMSLKGHDSGTVDYVFGDEAEAAIKEPYTQKKELYKGRIYRILSTPTDASGFSLMCVASTMTVGEFLLHFEWGMLIAVIIVCVMASILISFYIRHECEVLDRVNEALEDLAASGETLDIPDNIVGYDMRRMWASMHEIGKNLKKANRATFLTYEAYYRFAPKRIENILGRESITEVNIGDTRRINGTVAFIITPPDARIDENSVAIRNRFFALTEKHMTGTGGIFVSTESDLSVIRLLFTEDSRSSIRFGTDLAIDACADATVYNPTIILHYDSFVYGVAGTDTLAYTFLSAEDSDNLEHCARWLGTLGVNMIITEPVRARETGAWDTRYIGFILPEPENKDRRINLYEVLDATDAFSRHNKKRMADEFDSALNMFYEMDFYFARNAFTDILRESPTDEIAKWYLFECERLLNEEAAADFVGELHMDEK